MILAGICIYIVPGHRKLFEVCTGHRYKSYFSVMLVQYYISDRYNIYTGCRYDIFMMGRRRRRRRIHLRSDMLHMLR